VLEGVDALRKA